MESAIVTFKDKNSNNTIDIELLYNKKGIFSDTTIEELQRFKNTDYPIFADLERFIPEYKQRNND